MYFLITKNSYLKQEVIGTEPSPSARVPCLHYPPIARMGARSHKTFQWLFLTTNIGPIVNLIKRFSTPIRQYKLQCLSLATFYLAKYYICE